MLHRKGLAYLYLTMSRMVRYFDDSFGEDMNWD